MNRTQSSLFASLLLVFVSGVAVGGVGHYLYTAKSVTATSKPSPESFRKQFVEDMRKHVGMNEEQILKMSTILDQTRLQYKEVRDRMQPDMKRIKSEQREKINAILSPDQQKLYEKFRAERDAKAKQGNPPPPGL